MNDAHDVEGDHAKQRLLALLDRAAASTTPVAFWWRDDDAIAATPQLDRLLALAERHRLPLALAVIPGGASDALATRLADRPQVSILQHGWRHDNHARAGEKKIELGGDQPLPELLDDLRRGCARLKALFPGSFLPVLVPPWNRIADAARDARTDAGLPGLSTFGPAPKSDPHRVNVHLDILEWRPTRSIARAKAFTILSNELERRLAGDPEPLGILTHHLVHEEPSWVLLEETLNVVANHPAVRWPDARILFRLS